MLSLVQDATKLYISTDMEVDDPDGVSNGHPGSVLLEVLEAIRLVSQARPTYSAESVKAAEFLVVQAQSADVRASLPAVSGLGPTLVRWVTALLSNAGRRLKEDGDRNVAEQDALLKNAKLWKVSGYEGLSQRYPWKDPNGGVSHTFRLCLFHVSAVLRVSSSLELEQFKLNDAG